MPSNGYGRSHGGNTLKGVRVRCWDGIGSAGSRRRGQRRRNEGQRGGASEVHCHAECWTETCSKHTSFGCVCFLYLRMHTLKETKKDLEEIWVWMSLRICNPQCAESLDSYKEEENHELFIRSLFAVRCNMIKNNNMIIKI